MKKEKKGWFFSCMIYGYLNDGERVEYVNYFNLVVLFKKKWDKDNFDFNYMVLMFC